ncbi:hypothetical protein HORIV_56390 [Vreelandella olivaria]|uniref:Glycerate kinase n=1 Tax=Vreelandella olivaria TaxID=390919 RepID=A0ABM7GR09_9GAMM|nr:hypothetical protein HORIV_56390 [Halomonas olivaria]
MADGGEGSLDALIAATGAERLLLEVHDALGRARQAAWGWLSDQRTAFIELAEASGLQHLEADERTALHTSTFGVGELLLAALDQGAEKALLLLGGSATNDGGAGMLQALGARFLDQNGEPLPPGGAALNRLARLELEGLDPRLAKLSLEAAVDVDNPCWASGAPARYLAHKRRIPGGSGAVGSCAGPLRRYQRPCIR